MLVSVVATVLLSVLAAAQLRAAARALAVQGSPDGQAPADPRPASPSRAGIPADLVVRRSPGA